MVTKLGTSDCRLKADGMLHWSDGAVWSRCEADGTKSKEPEKHDVREEQTGPELSEKGKHRIFSEVIKKHSEGFRALTGYEQKMQALKEAEGSFWSHVPDIPSHERRRMERDVLERAKDREKEKEAEAFKAAAYIGKPDLPPSWGGGGWGGPKDGHDKDTRYMLRGEARELPDHFYKSWQQKTELAEQKLDINQKKKEKNQKKKDKKKDVKKNKKAKKDKKQKKSKKEKGKKDKKAAKKKRKNIGR